MGTNGAGSSLLTRALPFPPSRRREVSPMRYLVAAVALAPFVALLAAMLTGRARVRSCCGSLRRASTPGRGSGAARGSPPVAPGG